MKSFQSRLFPTLLVVLLGMVMMSAVLFFSLSSFQTQVIDAGESRYRSYVLATQLRRSSDDLTRLVRTYAATTNPRFEEQFWKVLAIRNGEIERPEHYDRIYWDFLGVQQGEAPYQATEAVALKSLMQRAGVDGEELALLELSHTHSDDLVNLERTAMNAMKGRFQDANGEFTVEGTPDRELALSLLFGEPYHEAKVSIMAPINQFYEHLDQRTQAKVTDSATRFDVAFDLQVVVFIATVLLLAVLIVMARRHHLGVVDTLHRLVDEQTAELNTSNCRLQYALEEIKTLRGIIPICSYCHSIRDDAGAWDRIEAYISEHTHATFSHGICPTCFEKVRDELDSRTGK